MNNNNASINELNSVLKGENMAIDSIEKVISHVKDDNIKMSFRRCSRITSSIPSCLPTGYRT